MILVLTSLLLASAAAGAERSIAELYDPGDEVAWVFEQRGERIGEHLFRYEGPGEVLGLAGHRFSAWTRLDAVPGVPVKQRYHAELWTDGAGHPLRHVLRARVGTQDSRMDVTFDAGKAAVHLVQGAGGRDLEVDVPDGAFLQTNNLIGWFELMLALHGPGEGESVELQLFSSNVLKSFPYRVRWKEALEWTEDGEAVPGAVLADSLGETISMAADGRLLELAVPAQGLVIRRSAESLEPFSLEPREDEEDRREERGERFQAEEVEIPRDGVVLAGTITKPRGAKGRLPAVFFVSGSGPQDRDGLSSGIDLGTREILDRLTEEGFLVLRVDDRGTGASTGTLDGTSYRELVGDARACVDFLFERADVDPRRVVLIGHSEGGVTAPLLAAEREEIAAIVLLAATGRPLIDVMVDQNRRLLVRAGVEGAALEMTLEQVRALLERIAGEEEIGPGELPAGQEGLLRNRAWLRDHAALDPAANVARVRCPVLILQGEMDFQVSAEKDARRLAEALDEAGHADHELRVFPGLDHLFKRVKGEESTMAEYFVEREVDGEFLEVLCGWLRQRVLTPPPR